DRAPPDDWDDAYANAAHIPGASAYPELWAREAAAFRAALGPRAELDLPYPGPLGDAEREAFDLFLPEGEPRGLAVFIHGGYWKAFGRESWSHLAAGAVARGWAVALPGYTLAPQARLGEITRQIAAFLPQAAARVPGPVRLAGHSAGGHLACRMLCPDVAVAPELRARIAAVLSISGLHDLRPLLRTAMAGTLRLDAAEAAAESPALHAPVPGPCLTAWVGGEERLEFLRQSALIADIWPGLGVPTRLVEEPGRHHFDVIAGLADANSPITEALLAPPAAP
ncbi:MAG: alpha/beta hydrolase, partial [Pseudomonadota bacterium]